VKVGSRERQQVEAELRLYPRRRRRIEELMARYAWELPPAPWSEDRITVSGTNRVCDLTWRSVERLNRNPEYRRLVRVVAAVERVYWSLDAQCRRVMEVYYWQGLGMDEVADQITASVDTVKRRRQEIVARVLEEFRASGIMTFEEAVG